MTKRQYSIFLRITAIAAFACFGVIGQVQQHTPLNLTQPNYSAPPTKQERMIASGECWNGGDNHPYPTRVWIHNSLQGRAAVDHALSQSDFGASLGVTAYCR